jgi:hypothetical protein
MARVDVTQDVVLERILARLRSELGLNERQCYETLDALAPPAIPKGGEWFVAISPTEGQFIEGEQASPNVTEEWGIIATIYTRLALDSTDHDEKLLRDATRGLLVLKKELLAALIGRDLQLESADDTGDTFVRQLIFARTCHRPMILERQGEPRAMLGMLSIDFGIHFDWDLT